MRQAALLLKSIILFAALTLPAGGELICRTDSLSIFHTNQLVFPNNEKIDLALMTYDGIGFWGNVLVFGGEEVFFQAISADYDSLQNIPETTITVRSMFLAEVRCTVGDSCLLTDHMENKILICSTFTGRFAKIRIEDDVNPYRGSVTVTWAYQTDGSKNVNTQSAIENVRIASAHGLWILPNPFNPSTRISYNLGQGRTGVMRIFNIRGRLVFERAIQGSGTVIWDASDLGSGVYVLKALSAGKTYSRKIILQR